jgi:hypothetical protein
MTCAARKHAAPLAVCCILTGGFSSGEVSVHKAGHKAVTVVGGDRKGYLSRLSLGSGIPPLYV